MPDGIALRFDAYTSGPNIGTPAYTAADERLLSAVLAHPGGALTARAGVRPGPGGTVSVGGTPEAVTVQPFSGIITDPAGGGSYIFAIPAAVSRNLATRPAGGTSRIDELVVRILNDGARPADGAREVEVHLIQGTAGASPSAPTIPTGQLRIRRLSVPSAGTISLTLPPARTTGLGGVLNVASQAERDAISPLYDGIMVYREDTDVFEGRANGAWQTIAFTTPDTGWINLPSVAGFTGTLRYRRTGGTVFAQADGAITTSSGNSTPLTTGTGIPAPYRPSVQARGGAYLGGHPGTMTVGAEGTVSVIQQSGATRGSAASMLSWPFEG